MNHNAQRLESQVRQKLDAGWNAFTREEVEALLLLLGNTRRSRHNVYQRVHTSHGHAVGWHKDGEVVLSADPGPEGSTNLFEKPPALNFVRGWRVLPGTRIPGYVVMKDGTLKPRRKNTQQSPNDVMRNLHWTLEALSKAYRSYDAASNEVSHEPNRNGTPGTEDLAGRSSPETLGFGKSEQSEADRGDLPVNGETYGWCGEYHPPLDARDFGLKA